MIRWTRTDLKVVWISWYPPNVGERMSFPRNNENDLVPISSILDTQAICLCWFIAIRKVYSLKSQSVAVNWAIVHGKVGLQMKMRSRAARGTIVRWYTGTRAVAEVPCCESGFWYQREPSPACCHIPRFAFPVIFRIRYGSFVTRPLSFQDWLTPHYVKGSRRLSGYLIAKFLKCGGHYEWCLLAKDGLVNYQTNLGWKLRLLVHFFMRGGKNCATLQIVIASGEGLLQSSSAVFSDRNARNYLYYWEHSPANRVAVKQ